MRLRFDVYTEDVEKHCRESAADVMAVESKMLGIAERAADEERRSHAYQNRTGNLEASTVGIEAGESGDLYAVELRMGDADAPYASFVVNRGFSRFHDIAKRAANAIASMVSRTEKKASR